MPNVNGGNWNLRKNREMRENQQLHMQWQQQLHETSRQYPYAQQSEKRRDKKRRKQAPVLVANLDTFTPSVINLSTEWWYTRPHVYYAIECNKTSLPCSNKWRLVIGSLSQSTHARFETNLFILPMDGGIITPLHSTPPHPIEGIDQCSNRIGAYELHRWAVCRLFDSPSHFHRSTLEWFEPLELKPFQGPLFKPLHLIESTLIRHSIIRQSWGELGPLTERRAKNHLEPTQLLLGPNLLHTTTYPTVC